jgi:hypothetical protein
MRGIVLGIVLACAGMVSQAEAACSVHGFSLYWGSDSQTTMFISGGSGCRVPIAAGGNSLSRFESVTISKSPMHGAAGIDGSNGILYRPRQGYKGDDEFAAKLCGVSRARTGCSTLRVQVKVE